LWLAILLLRFRAVAASAQVALPQTKLDPIELLAPAVNHGAEIEAGLGIAH